MQLAKGVAAPITRMYTRMVVGFGVALVAGASLGTATRDPLIGAAVAFNLSVVAAAIAWWPMFDPGFRSAIELSLDHRCRELADWKVETGTAMPRTVGAARGWLAEHPGAPGAGTLQLFLGQLREADRAIDAIDASTPEATFAVALLRQTRRLYAGDDVDLDSLHAAWRLLPETAVRRHRRECVALLEAQVAVDHGGDAIGILARARPDVGEIERSMRAPWLIARWSILGLAVLVVMTALLTQVH